MTDIVKPPLRRSESSSAFVLLVDALSSIGEFIEQVYNQARMHSALGYVPPAEFEQNGGATQ